MYCSCCSSVQFVVNLLKPVWWPKTPPASSYSVCVGTGSRSEVHQPCSGSHTDKICEVRWTWSCLSPAPLTLSRLTRLWMEAAAVPPQDSQTTCAFFINGQGFSSQLPGVTRLMMFWSKLVSLMNFCFLHTHANQVQGGRKQTTSFSDHNQELWESKRTRKHTNDTRTTRSNICNQKQMWQRCERLNRWTNVTVH